MVKKKLIYLLSFILVVAFSSNLFSKVSPEEAKKLGTVLTPFGAEKAGNKDGTIPSWTGGLRGIPEGVKFKPGDFYPDPFANDKPLFKITAQNMDKYADKLDEGQKALLKKYPKDYYLLVYKTRRTQALPEWFYKNTYKNALHATLTKDGLGVKNAFGGVPFPIPKNGAELIYNHLCRWTGASRVSPYASGIILTNGKFVPSGGGKAWEANPYYYKGGSYKTFNGDIWHLLIYYSIPERIKGEILLVRDPLNQSESKRKAWQYLPGQRRVRRAPTIAYDSPNISGTTTYDQAYQFNGAIDRYNWKILGKKEMYIPYNCYKFHNGDFGKVFTGYHNNPEYIRWELHRVWVLQATLKKGKRHVYAKRVFYIDEDSWIVALQDNYDGHMKLWRTSIGLSWNHYNLPGIILQTSIFYDLTKDYYSTTPVFNKPLFDYYAKISPNKGIDDSFFTPAYMRKLGRR